MEIAGPGSITGSRPAALQRTGTMFAVPKPANINPGAATHHELHKSNEPTPTAMSSPLTIKSHLPEICSASQSPVNLAAVDGLCFRSCHAARDCEDHKSIPSHLWLH